MINRGALAASTGALEVPDRRSPRPRMGSTPQDLRFLAQSAPFFLKKPARPHKHNRETRKIVIPAGSCHFSKVSRPDTQACQVRIMVRTTFKENASTTP